MKFIAGFSLIELLVVLTLFGLLTALLPQGLHKLYASSRAESTAYAIAGKLQDCAQRALQTQSTLVVGSGGKTSCNIDADANVELKFVGGIQPVFFADGSSNGGRIVVANEQRQILVTTNRITARVSVRIDDSR